MAVTETPADAIAGSTPTEEPTIRVEPSGLAAVLGSGDHKVLGRLFVGASLLFGLIVAGLGQLFAIEMLDTESLDIFGADRIGAAFTFYRFGLLLVVAAPLMIGLAYIVVPLQVGSRSIALPRAAALAFWGWLLGAFSFAAAAALTSGSDGSETAQLLYLTSVGLITVTLVVASICLATTVITLRHPGVDMLRVPVFSWSVLVSSVVWILSLPVLLAIMVLRYVDLRHAGGAIAATGTATVSPDWVIRNPQVYAVAIPVLGYAADVLSSTARTRIAPRSVVFGAIGLFGVLSLGGFLYTAGIDELETPGVVAMALLAVLPALAVLGLIGDLFRRGSFRMNAPVAHAVVALLVLVLGLLAGAIGAVPATEATGTIYEIGVSHAILLSAIIAVFGGLHWWATKVGQQPANDKLGLLAPVVLLAGTVAVVGGDLASGLLGENNELSPDWTGGMEVANIAVAVGTAVVILGLVIAAVSLLPMLKRPDEPAPADPWEGQSLEWLAPSPPPLANFDEDLPEVRSAEPLTDIREEK